MLAGIIYRLGRLGHDLALQGLSLWSAGFPLSGSPSPIMAGGSSFSLPANIVFLGQLFLWIATRGQGFGFGGVLG
jgi:hypothetical protein